MGKRQEALRCIALAKYRKYASSPSELKQSFKTAVSATDPDLKVQTELDSYLKMEVNIASVLRERSKFSEKLSAEQKKMLDTIFKGESLAESYDDYYEQTRSSRIFSIEMLAYYSDSSYVLDTKCVPFLIDKLDRHHGSEEEVSQTDIDLAYEKSASYLESVFVGGMGSERVQPVHPYDAKSAHHEILVNVSKSRSQLSSKLMESLKTAKKSVCACGWIGRLIVPEFKACTARGVELKIVTKRPQESNGRGVSDKSDAFNELRQFVSPDNVRLLSSCHARIVIVDDTVFVGSMDLDSEAIAERDEAAIVSEDANVVNVARRFFDELFSKGTKPDWKSISHAN